MNPVIAEPRFRTFYADEIAGRAPRPARAYALACIAGLLMTAGAGCLLLVGAATGFRARRLYAVVTARIARVVLRLYGIRLEVHGHLAAGRQVVYISNHTSTLDLFVLVALDLPRTRFFLSGFLRRVLPLGAIAWLLGTFFTVPQTRPAERRRIFARADRILRRTRESVYLSPEGGRITTGRIGHFNKGAFHLATSLRAPIVPLFIRIPPHVDPRRGLDARPGAVAVHVLPEIDTRDWRLDDLTENTARVRNLYVQLQEAFTCA